MTRLIEAAAEEMAKALVPLASVAWAVDESPSCAKHKRPDTAALWPANANYPSPFDLTMGHARAARRALDAWLSLAIERNETRR